MNLTIERAPALSALSRVTGLVERAHTIPILANVALDARDGKLTLRATDLNMEAVETFEAHVSEGGAITLPADKLKSIVQNSDVGAQVSLKLDAADPRAHVRSGKSRFAMPCLPADDFPQFRADDLCAGFSMPAKLLADMISRVEWAVSRANNNAAIENVYLARVDDQLHAVGCTSAGVALRREPAPDGSDGLKVMLPLKTVSQITGWLGEAEGDVHISWSETLIRFRLGEAQLTSKVFDAPNFVNYPFVVGDETQEILVKTDQDALKTAIRRVQVMKDAKSDALRLTFADGGMTVQMRNDQSGEGAEEIACDYEGDEVPMLVNARPLTSALASLRGDVVEIGFAAKIVEQPASEYARTVRVIVRNPSDPAFIAVLSQPRA